MLSEVLYTRDSVGNIRTWQTETNPENGQWRTISGLEFGKKVTSKWTTVTSKNIGKSNETTISQQAVLESNAEWKKKSQREYRQTIAELEFVPYSPMLAQNWSDQKDIQYPLYSQPKLDGIRSLTSRYGAFSREFQPHNNIDHIIDILKPLFEEYPDLMLDGELYNHDYKDDFNSLTSIIRKKKVTPEQRELSKQIVQYHVYDMISPEINFGDRIAKLSMILSKLTQPNLAIRLVPTIYCVTQDSLDSMYGEYNELGYEGQIVRLDGLYEDGKRSKNLLKRKEFITEEFTLLEIREGKGNWANFAKSTVVQLPNGKTCDTGMRGTQEFTKNLLLNRDDYVGGLVTIRYFGYTEDGKLRFPVAVDFHGKERVD